MPGNLHPALDAEGAFPGAEGAAGASPELCAAPEEGTPLLLHACCGPCAIMPALRLKDAGFAVTLWYMNPNIHPLAEYLRRREAVGECAARLGVPVICEDAAWDIRAWLAAPEAQELPPARCEWCCGSRVRAAAAAARALGFAYFTTSLLYSRYQPHEAIAATGRELAAQGRPAFVYGDFREDWQAGIDRSKEWGLYRQPYCGCIFSEAERYHKKLARCIRESAAN